MDGMFMYGMAEGIQQHYKRALKKDYNNLKLLLISDSFGKAIAPNFINGFAEVIHIHTNDIKPDEYLGLYNWIIEDVKPTHFLFLIHDGGLFGQTKMIEKFLSDVAKHK
jgi:hypothetical protein